MDSTEPIPHTDHVHQEYTPLNVETHYDQHACCFVIFLFLGLVCLGVVVLLFYFVVVVLGVEGDFVGYLTALPFCGFFFCGWRIGVSVYGCYKDSKKEGMQLVCLNVPKNRMAFVHVICSCYSQKEIISPLSRIAKFKYYNNERSSVFITTGDGEMFYNNDVEFPIFKIKQMIEILQGCNPEIVIEEPARVVNNDNSTILYDADNVTSDGSVSTSVGDTSTACPPPPSAFSTSSSSSLPLSDYNYNSSELHAGAENGDESGNGNSSSAEMEGLEQNTSSLPPYLLPSSVLTSVSASSTTASSSSSTPSTSLQ